jgi:hypothetical protein
LGYEALTDEEKIEEAIRFVAAGQPMPKVLEDFLRSVDLYDSIVNPQEV